MINIKRHKRNNLHLRCQNILLQRENCQTFLWEYDLEMILCLTSGSVTFPRLSVFAPASNSFWTAPGWKRNWYKESLPGNTAILKESLPGSRGFKLNSIVQSGPLLNWMVVWYWFTFPAIAAVLIGVSPSLFEVFSWTWKNNIFCHCPFPRFWLDLRFVQMDTVGSARGHKAVSDQ